VSPRYTVPATIPDLVQDCTPLVSTQHGGHGCVMRQARLSETAAGFIVSWCGVPHPDDFTDLVVPLDHPTGRAHAVWWVRDQDADEVFDAVREFGGMRNVGGGDELAAAAWLTRLLEGDDVSDAAIAGLQRIVLRLAGLDAIHSEVADA
jgi:hypothetical protein